MDTAQTEDLSTGVKGLDDLLGGGLPAHSLVLVEGAAGTGKTILAFQISSHLARQGKRVLFVTVLSEAHGKVVQHVQQFGFFDAAVLASSMRILNGFGELRARGLPGFLEVLAQEIATFRPTLLVLDGFGAAKFFATTLPEWGEFLLKLASLLSTMKCTGLLLTPSQLEQGNEEWALVDGVISVDMPMVQGIRRIREIEVVKLRGRNHRVGKHVFTISDDGIRIYPRLEASEHMTDSPSQSRERISLGVSGLDDMFFGGVLRESSTCLLGAPGTGKTVVSLSYLHSGLSQGEPCLYLGFYEPPAELLAKAEGLGMPLAPYVASGQLVMEWAHPWTPCADPVAERVLRIVREKGIRRVVIDSIEGFEDIIPRADRTAPLKGALLRHLRLLGATTLVTKGIDLFREELPSASERFINQVDNIILLRHVELNGQLRRLISIMKVRASAYDAAIKEFTVSAAGVDVTGTFENVERLLTGSARRALSP